MWLMVYQANTPPVESQPLSRVAWLSATSCWSLFILGPPKPIFGRPLNLESAAPKIVEAYGSAAPKIVEA